MGRMSRGIIDSKRLKLWVALIAAALVVIPTAVAWACNPQAHMSLNRTSYSPGQTIVINGSYFNDQDTIKVSGPNGSTTATPSGGGFRVALTAPSSPGSYTITATKDGGGYRAGLPKSASFAVASPASAGSGDSSPSEPGRSPTSPTTQGSPDTQDSTPSFGEPGVGRSPSSSTQQQRTTARQRGGNGGGSSSPAAGTVGSRITAGVAGGGTITTGASGQRVFAGSAAPGQQSFLPSAGGSKSANGSTNAAGVRPSERAATADVWSGFAPGKTASLMAGADQPGGGTGSQLGLGIGLLAFGLVALMSGLTAAEVRRRRASAGS